MASAIIFDIDGTLVDSNYHHAIAWFRAFRRSGIVIPIWQLHRHIGMGGDRMVSAVTDERTEHEYGDDIRAAEGEIYSEMIEEVLPFDGARGKLVQLKEEGHPLVLSSSAKSDEVEHYVDLLEARDLVDAWTTSADVGTTKPEPDLIHSALDAVGGGPAWMVGDATWDVEAAAKADVPTIAVRTGGFSEDELLTAGAKRVVESIRDLEPRLFDDPPVERHDDGESPGAALEP